MPATPPLDPERLMNLLGTDSRWGPIDWVASTSSTNDDMVAKAKLGAPTGSVLLSEHQEGGKARFDRVWQDIPGTMVATSALVEPQHEPQLWGWLSLLTGIAVREGTIEYTGAAPERVTLKWPNDVMLDGRKVCGILSERVADRAVLGFGLNVSMDDAELPVSRGISLALASLPHEKTQLMACVLSCLDSWLETWQSRGEIRAEYGERCDTIGRCVRIQLDEQRSGTEQATGTAIGVDGQGALIVDVDGLGRRVFTAGDVIHLRKPGESFDS